MKALGISKLEIAITDAKCCIAMKFLLIQAIMKVYNMYREQLLAANTMVLVEVLYSIGNIEQIMVMLFVQSCKNLGPCHRCQMPDPPLLHLESESYQASPNLLQNLIVDRSVNNKEVEAEAYLVELCEEVLHVYLETSNLRTLLESHRKRLKPHLDDITRFCEEEEKLKQIQKNTGKYS